MRIALLAALLALLAPPDFRVTRTVSGVRLRLAGVPAPHLQLFVAGGPGLRVFRQAQLDRERDGSFGVDLPLPDAAFYMAYAEFTPDGGRPQMAQQAFTTGSAMTARAGAPDDEPHESNGVSATVDMSQAKAGRESTLAFDLSEDAAGGAPELFFVSADLTEGRHVQAADGAPGRHVVFTPVFPRRGRYKVWLILPRSGRAATIPFAIDVP